MKLQFIDNRKPSTYRPAELKVILTGSDSELDNIANICECINWALLEDPDLFDGDRFDTVLTALKNINFAALQEGDEPLEQRQEVIGQLLLTLDRLYCESSGKVKQQQLSDEYTGTVKQLVNWFLFIHQATDVAADVKLYKTLLRLEFMDVLLGGDVIGLAIYMSEIAADLSDMDAFSSLTVLARHYQKYDIEKENEAEVVAEAVTKVFEQLFSREAGLVSNQMIDVIAMYSCLYHQNSELVDGVDLSVIEAMAGRVQAMDLTVASVASDDLLKALHAFDALGLDFDQVLAECFQRRDQLSLLDLGEILIMIKRDSHRAHAIGDGSMVAYMSLFAERSLLEAVGGNQEFESVFRLCIDVLSDLEYAQAFDVELPSQYIDVVNELFYMLLSHPDVMLHRGMVTEVVDKLIQMGTPLTAENHALIMEEDAITDADLTAIQQRSKPSTQEADALFTGLTKCEDPIDNLHAIQCTISAALIADPELFEGNRFDAVLMALQEVAYDLHTHDPETYAYQQVVIGKLLFTLYDLFEHSQGRLLVQQHSEQYRAILSELTDHFLLIYRPVNFQADVELFDVLCKFSVERQLFFLKDTNVHNLSIFISCIAADLNADQAMNALHLMRESCDSCIDAGQDLSGVANALTELFKNRIKAADSLSPTHIVACLDIYFELSRLGMGLCDDVEPQEMAYLASLLGNFNLMDATVSIPDLEAAIYAMNGLGYTFDYVLDAYYCRADELDFDGAWFGLETIFDESNAGDPLVMQYADNFLSLCLEKSIVATVDEQQPVRDALIQMKTILQYAELANDRGIILAEDFEVGFNALVRTVLSHPNVLAEHAMVTSLLNNAFELGLAFTVENQELIQIFFGISLSAEHEDDADDELASVTAVSAMSRFGIMPIPRDLISPITVPAPGMAKDEFEEHVRVVMCTPG